MRTARWLLSAFHKRAAIIYETVPGCNVKADPFLLHKKEGRQFRRPGRPANCFSELYARAPERYFEARIAGPRSKNGRGRSAAQIRVEEWPRGKAGTGPAFREDRKRMFGSEEAGTSTIP